MIYVIIFLLVFILFVIHSCVKIDISRFYIKDRRIDKDIKIMLLSDLHNRDIKNKLDNIIEKESPDIIILCGDMVNEYEGEDENFIKLISSFDKYKTYYTFGNHEEELGKKIGDKYINLLNKTKIIVLNDKSVSLSKNIMLYGLDADISFFDSKRIKKLNKEYIENKIGKLSNDKYNILVAHNPLIADIYSDYGFDLTLSGHVHGGIVRLPIFGGLLSPEYKFFPKYYEGVYNIKGMKLIVCRGLGFSRRLPIRILNPGEVVIINVSKN